MSVKNDVSFHLLPSEKGYTLTIDFPCLETHKEIPFIIEQSPTQGGTFDLYSQNGKVLNEYPLGFFNNHDVKALKKALKTPLPLLDGQAQSLFVLDLKDQNGNYMDLESIRQSGTLHFRVFKI